MTPQEQPDCFERWESQAALEDFRRSGPPFEHRAAMLAVSAAEYDVADVRPLFGGGTAGAAPRPNRDRRVLTMSPAVVPGRSPTCEQGHPRRAS